MYRNRKVEPTPDRPRETEGQYNRTTKEDSRAKRQRSEPLHLCKSTYISVHIASSSSLSNLYLSSPSPSPSPNSPPPIHHPDYIHSLPCAHQKLNQLKPKKFSGIITNDSMGKKINLEEAVEGRLAV
ncbi:hypothetical protein CLIB1423_09S04104 [[Candida] railenensis]|uniref:Uncharacterized protein n=1 Tax=[Candida] railenensis TaxID=45579 RepID=A0A9P0QQM4_9ASCO|nr:hypothetical protein CLIB1423_09S04104 [[Candida] railenensis]